MLPPYRAVRTDRAIYFTYFSYRTLVLPGRKSLVESLVEDPSSSSSLRSRHRRLPTAALRPCSYSADRRSRPSRALKLSGFLRTLSCRLDRGNCTGAWLPPHCESLDPSRPSS